ncbi:hypothetical protein C4577_06500 [Candidatus Parcubacteria bacterium]|nr:MAG: hypothetical protein C4577_06500 [Candidatus Parcubacteria bacterium]
MISKNTVSDVVPEILYWCKERNVKYQDMNDLLKVLAIVPGNKSFRDSMCAITQKFEEVIKTYEVSN